MRSTGRNSRHLRNINKVLRRLVARARLSRMQFAREIRRHNNWRRERGLDDIRETGTT